MYIKEQITDPNLKQCPFCNQTIILVSTVSYPNGDDDGYKVACLCGQAARILHGWEANKMRLIKKWNDYIWEVDENGSVV